MLIKNFDYAKIIFVSIAIICILYFNTNRTNNTNNATENKMVVKTPDAEILSEKNKNFEKNYKLLMKNIQNQNIIMKKLDKIDMKSKQTNKLSDKNLDGKIKQIYVKETLDGSKELNPIIQSTNPIIQTNPITQLDPIYKMKQQTQFTDPVYIRDNQVLNDKLYPPLGRTERPQFDLLMNFINNQPGIFNMYTRGPPDTFRVLGYMTPMSGTQTIDNTLILYGRAKWEGSDIGDFYATSSSKISDIKIPLTQYNCNIRRIWDIPEIIEITGPMMGGKYNFTELPKPDLTHPYI
jgi:hypothetical protein